MLEQEHLIEVPCDAIDPETLYRLVEEFVTRDGTDYGEAEVAMETKVQQIISGLKRRQWLIIVDTAMQNTQIVDAAAWQRRRR